MAQTESDVTLVSLGDLPPTPWQSRLAVTVSAMAFVAFIMVAPFAGTPLATLNIFFPLLDAIVFVTDLVTAALLFAQFTVTRWRALFVLATGYLFTALIVVPHALTFSGAFSPTGLLGANIQTGSWLFIFWHAGFAAALLAYAILRSETRIRPIPARSSLPAISWSVAGVFFLVCGLTWLSTAGATVLPPIIFDNTRISHIVIYPILATILMAATAIVVIGIQRRSVLDLWLMVVAFVYIGELAFSGLFPSARFSLGFYAGRVFSIVTSSIVLIVLLSEMTMLYAFLAKSAIRERTARRAPQVAMDAVAASIAHELAQPLGAIVLNSDTALRYLAEQPPNNHHVQEALLDIARDGTRASAVIANVRNIFKNSAPERAFFNANNLIREVLSLLEVDLRTKLVSVSIDLNEEIPEILADRGQMQQVFLNLIINAAESMIAVTDRSRELKISSGNIQGSSNIFLAIEDTGIGIETKHRERIFDPFFTTKATGSGIGLAICRLIIESHGGSIRVSAKAPHGTIFEVEMPAFT